jgi:hypothetical protein
MSRGFECGQLWRSIKVNHVSGMWTAARNPTRDAILSSLAPCKIELKYAPHGERGRGEGLYPSEVRQPFPILLNPRNAGLPSE